MHLPGRALERDGAVYAACAVTLTLGLFFVFVWAPHPWGWEGFDHYHELAMTLARGRPFPTMDVPWGYAYFAAGWYRLFGDRPWIVLLIQVLLNAALPWLVFRFALTWTDRATAIVAAVLTGVFSFNTIYASTQSSDAVCTVLFMTAIVTFGRARRRDRWWLYAAVGVMTGLAAQFRPNLILVPACLAAYAVLEVRTRRRVLQSAVLLVCAAAALSPWIIRNYRLTHLVLPTSVHGGVQLWYGTLQVGPYLHSRAYNPRAVFETPVFDSTSLAGVPMVVTANSSTCGETQPFTLNLIFWTDADPVRHGVPAVRDEDGGLRFEIPAPGHPAVVYYYFDARWQGPEAAAVTTPADGDAAPFVYFVSNDHLGDLDVHGDIVDIFDLVRLVRHRAWSEPLAFDTQLARAQIGSGDVERAAAILARAAGLPAVANGVVASLDHDEHEARLTFHDGSSMTVPRAWSGHITDVAISGPLALRLMRSAASIAALARAEAGGPPARKNVCGQLSEIAVNRVFYRQEPHMMRRYMALAFDNIRRDPGDFVRASAYRALRVFVVEGTDDHYTAQQFSSSALVYRVATVATVVTFMVFSAGVVLAWRRGDAILLPLLLVAYVPLTIAPVLTNMRYSVTVQPIIFIFIAAAVTALAGRAGLLPAPPAARGRAGNRTAPVP